MTVHHSNAPEKLQEESGLKHLGKPLLIRCEVLVEVKCLLSKEATVNIRNEKLVIKKKARDGCMGVFCGLRVKLGIFWFCFRNRLMVVLLIVFAKFVCRLICRLKRWISGKTLKLPILLKKKWMP